MTSPIALVTGGSRGIGQAVSSALELAGWQVLAPTRSELDLSDRESIRSFAAAINEPISGLVLNAGINEPSPLAEMPIDSWNRIHEVNSTASFELIAAFVPAMAAARFGRIVAISSAYVNRARAGRAAYSSSKASLEALVRSTALEFAGSGVVANCVAPGFVDTDLTRANNSPEMIADLLSLVPVGRLATVEEIGRTVAFLMSTENQYITGQTLNVDGGFSCR